MVGIQEVSVSIAAIGVLIAAINSVITSRRSARAQELTLESQKIATETRQAQLYMNLYQIVTTEDYLRKREEIMRRWEWEDYTDFQKKYGVENNPEATQTRQTLMRFYGGLNALVKRNLIDVGLLSELLGWDGFASDIFVIWDKLYPVWNFETRAKYQGGKVTEDLDYREGYETFACNMKDLYYTLLKHAEEQQQAGVKLPVRLQHQLQRDREKLAKG